MRPPRLLGAIALVLAACNPPIPEPVPFGTLGLAREIADQGTARWPAADLPFDWIPTVWGYGILRLYDASGEDAWRDYDRAWMDEAIADIGAGDPPVFHSSDSMSPALVAAGLMVRDATPDYSAITDLADAWLAIAPRTDEGAIEHWSEASPFGVPGQVWVDSQFMFGLFLLEQHARTGITEYLDEWVSQYLLFSDLCRDPVDQLYRHAYDDATDANVPQEAVYWARGNAWVLVSAAEMLARVGTGDPASTEVLPLFRAHAEAVLAVQEPEDGLWHTVLNEPVPDDPANYTETSASALIAYAFARGIRSGALEGQVWHEALSRAVAGIRGRVDRDADDGIAVEGTSYGTNPGDYGYYVGIPVGDDLQLGVGSVVLLLSEVDGMEDPLAEEAR